MHSLDHFALEQMLFGLPLLDGFNEVVIPKGYCLFPKVVDFIFIFR